MLTETTLMPFVLLRPWCLLGIVAALLIFAIRYQTDKKAKRQGLIAAHLSEHLVSMPSQSKSQRFTFPILTAIASIALAGPSWRSVDMPVYQVEKAQVLVLDESYSMYATDLTPNRLSQQKYKATDLIKQWDEGEKALITYAGDAFTIAPLTTDGHSILNQIPHISPEIMPVTGSNADLALEKGISLLENSGYAKGQIVFFTDGIDQATSEKMIDRLKGTPWTVSILGFGTEQGSAITMPDGSLLKNSQNEIVVPTLDQAPLRAIAQAGNGLYLTVTTDNSDIQKLGNYFNVNNLHKKKAGQESKNQFAIDDGYWIAFLLVPCFLLLFRKGLFYILILSVFLPLSIPRVEASVWQNKQQAAFQAYQGQDYQKAADLYASPMDKGSALYKKKDYKGAIEQFKKLNFKTPQNAPAFYNQGNAFAQLKEFDKAIKAYDDALNIDPNFKDARENKALVEKLKKQQDQQKKKQQKNQQQKSQQQKSEQQKSQQQKSQQQKSQQQKTEQQKTEQQKTEQQKTEQQKSEQQKSEQQKSEQQKSEQQKSEQQKSEQQKSEQQKSEQQKSEQQKSEQQKSEQQKSEQQKSEQQKSEQQKSEQQKSEQQKSEQQKSQQQKRAEKKKQAAQQKANELQKAKQAKKPNQELKDLPLWLKNMPDDPSLLLRNKMRLEYKKRMLSQPINQQQNGDIW